MPEDNRHILVIEDEPPIRQFIRTNLERAGFQVTAVATGEEGLAAVAREHPALVVLDLRLPGMDGFTVCRRLRDEHPEVAVIILTARAQDTDKVLGLELGADDYVTKPFNPLELVARVRAILRRLQAAAPARRLKLCGGRLLVDPARREVLRDGRPVPLTPREFDLLACLAGAPGRALNRNDLLDAVWGRGYVGDPKTVDVYIRRLREKLEDDPGRPALIETVWGVGYRLRG
ncbi:MAG: response regulator transcription factor [Bacillota bacterium]